MTRASLQVSSGVAKLASLRLGASRMSEKLLARAYAELRAGAVADEPRT